MSFLPISSAQAPIEPPREEKELTRSTEDICKLAVTFYALPEKIPQSIKTIIRNYLDPWNYSSMENETINLIEKFFVNYIKKYPNDYVFHKIDQGKLHLRCSWIQPYLDLNPKRPLEEFLLQSISYKNSLKVQKELKNGRENLEIKKISPVTFKEDLAELSSKIIESLDQFHANKKPEEEEVDYFFGKKLTYLPPESLQLHSSSELSVSHNLFTSLPEKIFDLGHLESIYSFMTPLRALSPKIKNLSNLKTLSITSALLTFIPDEIGELKKLEFLSLDYNYLTSLPKTLNGLTGLKRLHLSNNKLTSLPNLQGLKNLWELDVSHNYLKKLIENAMPPSLTQLCIQLNMPQLSIPKKLLRRVNKIDYDKKDSCRMS